MKMTYSKNIVLPERFTCEIQDNGAFGKFYIYPLQKGFGATVGNIFRRVLLSSIKGFAFTSINIPSIYHECSIVGGIQQDLSTIIYNLRRVVIKSGVDNGTATINVSAAKKYFASDIVFSSSNISVINPDLHLFDVVDDNLNFDITLSFDSGVGDLFVEDVVSDKKNYGDILIDAHFSPVVNVAFSVEETRVLNKTDYDKLCIQIKTNGSVDARSAMEDANTILYNFISAIADIKNDVVVVDDISSNSSSDLGFDFQLFKRIEDIEFSARAHNCLKHEGIEYIGDLVVRKKEDMLRAPNLGRKSLVEIENILKQMGYSFDMDITDWHNLRNDSQAVSAAQKILQDL
ncbi:MAG: hypothetical protein RL208_75 [Pseudomonadota bacterium]|jgi:DNA-directed RNA polymerase subunit alpha